MLPEWVVGLKAVRGEWSVGCMVQVARSTMLLGSVWQVMTQYLTRVGEVKMLEEEIIRFGREGTAKCR